MFEGLKAPEIDATGWLNSPPLRLKDLRERAVLLNIWDYTCINCLRSLPYLTEWHRRYSRWGLVIIGVHCPEFDFARDRRHVERAVRDFGLPYPVALDNDHRVWNAYANRYWPRSFLIDRRGVIRFDHIGEGAYRQTELKIQELLAEVYPAGPTMEPLDAERPRPMLYPVTPELYAGYQRGRLGNPEGYRPNQIVEYREVERCVDGFLYLKGRWLNLAQSLQHASPQTDWIGLRYHSVSVNAVISTSGRPPWPLEVEVKQDGRALSPEVAGEDVLIERGRSFILVEQPRMYRLVTNPGFGYHILRLYTGSDLLRLHAFTFGGRVVEREERQAVSGRA